MGDHEPEPFSFSFDDEGDEEHPAEPAPRAAGATERAASNGAGDHDALADLAALLADDDDPADLPRAAPGDGGSVAPPSPITTGWVDEPAAVEQPRPLAPPTSTGDTLGLGSGDHEPVEDIESAEAMLDELLAEVSDRDREYLHSQRRDAEERAAAAASSGSFDWTAPDDDDDDDVAWTAEIDDVADDNPFLPHAGAESRSRAAAPPAVVEEPVAPPVPDVPIVSSDADIWSFSVDDPPAPSAPAAAAAAPATTPPPVADRAPAPAAPDGGDAATPAPPADAPEVAADDEPATTWSFDGAPEDAGARRLESAPAEPEPEPAAVDADEAPAARADVAEPEPDVEPEPIAGAPAPDEGADTAPAAPTLADLAALAGADHRSEQARADAAPHDAAAASTYDDAPDEAAEPTLADLAGRRDPVPSQRDAAADDQPAPTPAQREPSLADLADAATSDGRPRPTPTTAPDDDEPIDGPFRFSVSALVNDDPSVPTAPPTPSRADADADDDGAAWSVTPRPADPEPAPAPARPDPAPWSPAERETDDGAWSLGSGGWSSGADDREPLTVWSVEEQEPAARAVPTPAPRAADDVVSAEDDEPFIFTVAAPEDAPARDTASAPDAAPATAASEPEPYATPFEPEPEPAQDPAPRSSGRGPTGPGRGGPALGMEAPWDRPSTAAPAAATPPGAVDDDELDDIASMFDELGDLDGVGPGTTHTASDPSDDPSDEDDEDASDDEPVRPDLGAASGSFTAGDGKRRRGLFGR